VSPAPARSLALLASASVLATMLYTIDSTIVNVALPHMEGSLQATQDQAAWILTAYIVVSAIATPLAGWLGSRFGLRRVLLVSIVGFTAGSVLCGLANGLAAMVAFRMIQGAFGAALVPLSQIVLLQEFPRESQARVTALWGIAVMVGPIIGPTLGGWLTDAYSWRWAFYINLPIGVFAWIALAVSMPKDHAASNRPFDMKGFILLSMAIGLFQLMLDRGETSDWFSSTEIVAEAFFAAVALYTFVAHSLTTRQPFVDMHLFRDRNFSIALIIQLAIGMFALAPSVLLPNFLQQLQGYTPAQAGVLMASRGAASMVAMFAASRVSARMEPRSMIMIGLVAVSGSMWMMASFSVDTPARDVVVAGLCQGFGIPLCFLPMMIVAFATLPDSSRTEAGALLTLSRNIGGSAGISIVVALLSRSAQVNQSYLTEHFTAYSTDRLQRLGGAPGPDTATIAVLGEIGRQALAIAYSNDFYLLAACTLGCIPIVLLLRRGRRVIRAAVAAQDAGH
jgi:DHA2 family multidrug resistance protein